VDGARGEEMFDADRGALDAPAPTGPGGGFRRRGEEDHAVRGVQVGGDDRQRGDVPARDVGLDAWEVDVRAEEPAEGRGVEQRLRLDVARGATEREVPGPAHPDASQRR